VDNCFVLQICLLSGTQIYNMKKLPWLMQAVLEALRDAGIVERYGKVQEIYTARVPVLKIVDSQTGTLLALPPLS